jgi:integrase
MTIMATNNIDVQPIRSLEKIEDMKWALRKFCSERDYILFLIGINTGLRTGDLLKLKVSDVKRKKKLTVSEGKTGKRRVLHLANIYDEIQQYIDTLPVGTIYLFPSKKGNKPISVTQAYRVLNKAADMAEVDSVGCHTLRKTFSYWFYKQHKDIALLQDILNHTHPSITLRYIGITAENVERSLENFVL